MAEVPKSQDVWSTINIGEKIGWTLIALGGLLGAISVVTGNPEFVIPVIPLVGLGLIVKEIARQVRLNSRDRHASTQPAAL